MLMLHEPNGKMVQVNLSISPQDKKWLRDHSWVNASGLLRDAIQKLRESLDEKEFYKPLR